MNSLRNPCHVCPLKFRTNAERELVHSIQGFRSAFWLEEPLAAQQRPEERSNEMVGLIGGFKTPLGFLCIGWSKRLDQSLECTGMLPAQTTKRFELWELFWLSPPP
jgi:hypothetical protein